ncbi:YcaO-like family protein [Clostridium algidicarnis]|uniref:YcaO-like family protein n=1 Tax=Clostridium algidicarnis TaxID=37659 RepID=UPI001C0BD75F|nr:YcaO-like family protein [Clostridium algidicarnis]MBU3228913.1 YcaO-like family protein [Clostridium algidicarnis]MBU3252457.1 YcaO-like family protein [Clostridium algidicarnis]
MDIIRNTEIKYRYNNPTYLNDTRFSFVFSKNNSIVSGSCINFDSKIPAILASVGEFLERERFMPNDLNRKVYKNYLIEGYSFIDKKLIKVNINKVIGNINTFTDSCGLASHTNSEECIFNAIKEFIERQSFILNYLSKGSTKLINLGEGGKFEYALKKFRNLKFYDISLIEDFYVILGKVVHNGNFYIGLGASNCIDKAILQCIKEIYQMDYAYYYEEKSRLKYNNKKVKDYMDVFMNLPTERLIEAYRYLDENCTICQYDKLIYKEFSIEWVFKQLNEKHSMNPLIFFLQPLRDIDTLKFVKIIDLKWFPNLFPKSYEQKVYDFVEGVTNKKLDRKCQFIPFP